MLDEPTPVFVKKFQLSQMSESSLFNINDTLTIQLQLTSTRDIVTHPNYTELLSPDKILTTPLMFNHPLSPNNIIYSSTLLLKLEVMLNNPPLNTCSHDKIFFIIG